MDNAKKKLSGRTKGAILVILSTFMSGIIPVVSQFAYATGLNSYSLVFGRYCVGLLMYFCLVLIKKESLRITLKQFAWICFVTIFGYSCILAMFVSYNYLSSGMASLIAMTYVVFAVIFEIILRISKGVWYKWVTLVLSVIGIAFISLSPGDSAGITPIGLVIGFFGAIMGACQLISFSNKIIKPLSIPQIFFYEMMLPIVLTPVVARIMGVPAFPVNMEQWMFSGLIAILQLGLGITLFYSGVRLLGAGDASLLAVLEPVFAFIAGAIVFHDPITSRMVVGGTIILGAVIFMTYCQNNEEKKLAQAMDEHLEIVKEEAKLAADKIIEEQNAK